jgi:large subunit ribosomal protein L25
MKKAESKEKVVLQATKRVVFGKKNKNLRKQGLLPANVFGPGIPSQSVSVNYIEFRRTFKKVGETGVVYVKTESEEIPTLISLIQRDPIEGLILHADFRKVDLHKKITAEVPLSFVGVAHAVNLGGVLLTQTDKVTVESLPQDIPSSIEVDVTVLKEVGQEIKVSDLVVAGNVTITTEATKVIVSVAAHKEESTVAETTAAEAPEVITAKEEVAEGAEAGKAEAPADDAKTAKKE